MWYSSISIKIARGIQCHHHGETRREGKLTKTGLFIVIVADAAVHCFLDSSTQMIPATIFRLLFSSPVLFHSNSLVNPVLDKFRMPQLRKALFSVLDWSVDPIHSLLRFSL